MPRSENVIPLALIVLSLYALTFGGLPEVGFYFQYSAILLSIAASFFLLPKAISIKTVSYYEVSVAVICLSSFTTLVIAGESGSKFTSSFLIYTAGFAVTAFSVFINARAVPLETFLKLSGIAAVLSIGSVAVAYPGDLLSALTASGGGRWALRFSAFGNHPVLEGVIFGVYAIYATYFALTAKRFRKTLMIFPVIAVLIILAASSRGALFALGLVSLALLAVVYQRLSQKIRNYIHGAALFGLVLAVLLGGQIYDYLVVALELDSKYRGLDSGASGRTGLWRMGFELIASSFRLVVFGGGLRWSDESNLGFYTENSYITILLDSGIIVGTYYIYSVFKAGGAVYGAARERPDLINIVMFALVWFTLIATFFNRYLVGIGNTFSFLCFYLFAYASSDSFTKRSTDLPDIYIYIRDPSEMQAVSPAS